MSRVLSILSVSMIFLASTAEAAKPPAKPATRPVEAVTKAERNTGRPKRAPANVSKFICEDPETSENTQAAVLAKFLNDKCDPSRTFTITMTNPGSTYPITVCCVSK
jgi:hypothetical protein